LPPFQYHFGARALEPTQAIALDGRALRGRCEEDHDLGYELLKRFAQVMVQRLAATRLRFLPIPSSGAEFGAKTAYESALVAKQEGCLQRVRCVAVPRSRRNGRSTPC
jgi:CRP-like cAMP-binding protein